LVAINKKNGRMAVIFKEPNSEGKNRLVYIEDVKSVRPRVNRPDFFNPREQTALMNEVEKGERGNNSKERIKWFRKTIRGERRVEKANRPGAREKRKERLQKARGNLRGKK